MVKLGARRKGLQQIFKIFQRNGTLSVAANDDGLVNQRVDFPKYLNISMRDKHLRMQRYRMLYQQVMLQPKNVLVDLIATLFNRA